MKKPSNHKKYKGYMPDNKWLVLEIFKLLAIWGIATFLFYNSVYGAVLTVPLVGILFFFDIKDYQIRQKKKIIAEFKNVITLVSGNLNAGYSLENSWVEARKDYKSIYGCNSNFARELDVIVNGISINKSIVDMLRQIGIKLEIKEINEFANVIEIANRYGGNMMAIIRQTSINLSDKKTIEDEIDTLVSSKKLESLIMLYMPFLMLAYLRITNPGYLDVLYETLTGRMIMSFCFGIVIVSYIWMRKILKIVDDY